MATVRIDVKPELLYWAFERAGDRGAKLRERIPEFDDWVAGTEQPTLKQLEKFANAARVAVGYLFLPAPPVEQIPIPDLRTVGTRGIRRPSPDMLDVIHLCQLRQDWYREYAEQIGEDPKGYVGSATIESSVEQTSREMQKVLTFSVGDREIANNTAEAMRMFINKAESSGTLVMVSGIVGENKNRKLDPEEFRGFAMTDPVAPLVFVNGSDSPAAQMFTLAHELAHIWLGTSAVSNSTLPLNNSDKTERWCNHVAAEFLVPLEDIKNAAQHKNPMENLQYYIARFKVSSLVIIRRLLDAGVIGRREFDAAYAVASQRHKPKKKDKDRGGDFYNTFPRSASRRLIRALVADTLEGNTSYREALQLLGVKKADVIHGLAARMQIE